MKNRLIHLAFALAAVLISSAGVHAQTAIQWGANRTASPWSVCAYDINNVCQQIFLLPPAGGGAYVPPQNGGTGINNGSYTISLGGNVSTGGSFTLSGAYSLTATLSGNTSLTLPTSGTVVVAPVPNAQLANPSTTVNGQTCTLGSTCTITASAGTITPGVTTIAGGTSGAIEYNDAGYLGEKLTTGSGNVVLATSPTLATPTLTSPTISNPMLSGTVSGAGTIPNSVLVNSTISGISLGSNLDALTFGTHLTAGGSSYNGSAPITITSDATNANTASSIVARDASGNFSAGTITATVTGHSSLDLALTGGTMSGNIAMGSSAITGASAYNGVTPTALSTGFSLAGGTTSKTLTVDNTLALAGTDSSTLNIGSGGTLGTFAFQSYASPPAIGGTTPAAGSFSTLTATSALVLPGAGIVVANGALSATFTPPGIGVLAALSAQIAGFGGIGPVVANNTQLSALASTYATSVTRLGYSTVGDSPPLVYTSSSSACSLNAGAGDGGSQVPTSDGKCWLGDLRGGAYASQFGAVGDGVTDDSAALVAEGNAAQAAGVIANLGGFVYAVGTSADLTLPGVEYRGSIAAYGYNSNFATAPYTLLLNPAHTINLKCGGALVGVKVYPQGMGQQASTLRGALTQIASFAGTGLTISSNTCNPSTDIKLSYVDVNGFALGINHLNSDRVHYDHVEGDDTNFRLINGCGDTCTDNQLEAWPFMASPYALNPQTQSTAISAFSSGSGGVVEVAFASAPATPIVTGDTIIIGNTGAAYQFPNGRWTVTAIDTSHFTLNGSTYSAASATNEIAYLTASTRQGYGFEFENTGVISVALVDFGHDLSLVYGSGVDGMDCVGCWLDGDTDDNTFADNVPIRLTNGGTKGNAAVLTQHASFHGKIFDGAIAVYNNSTSGGRPLIVEANPLPATGCAAVPVNGPGGGGWGSAVWVVSGSVLVDASHIEGNCAGQAQAIAIDDAATFLTINATPTEVTINSLTDAGLWLQTPSTDCFKYSYGGEILCPWTPALAGTSAAGTETPVSGFPVGTISIIGKRVTAWFNVEDSSLSGATGNLNITGLPVAAASITNDNGTCAISRIGGLAFDPNYFTLVAQVSQGQNAIAIGEAGSGLAVSTAALPADSSHVAAIAASGNTQIQGVCSYHE